MTISPGLPVSAKICGKCGAEKKVYPSGSSSCQPCNRQAQRRYRLKHPEKVREAHKQFLLSRPEKRKEYGIKYREREREWRRRYKLSHPEKVRENKKRYRDRISVEVALFNRAKLRARKTNREFKITREDIVVPAVCPQLGIPLKRVLGGQTGPGSPSLDRIDNSKGYVPGNVWVISFRANTLKRDATLEEQRTLVRNLEREEISRARQSPHIDS